MFATLLGPLPRPPLPAAASPEAIVRALLLAQEEAGLEPVTDAGWWRGRPVVEAWRATADLSTHAVKQVLIGPVSAAGDDALTAARELNAVLRGLADAGCPLIEVHEPALAAMGSDANGWSRFMQVHEVLTEGVTGTHLSLAIIGGAVDVAGIPSVVAAPYASLAVDLIAGPDNWRLVRAAPGTLGIVCGAMSPLPGAEDGPETLLWAAAYAASGDGRGPRRVGIATASSLAGLTWDVAIAKVRRLGEAARLADLPADELRRHLDPRAIDSRSAGLGRTTPP